MVVGPSGGPSGPNRTLALCSASSASAARRAATSSIDPLPFRRLQYLKSQIGIAAHPSRRPPTGRAFARPVGGLLRMRSNLLKHNNLMLRSERRERLEAWAASDQPISHSSVLERDDFSSKRHPALSFCLSMIFSENRYPLFRIMLQRDDFSSNRHPAPSFCLS